MKEHAILFGAEMIDALLAGRKSVTRRMSRQWLNVKLGDRLWVREQLRRPDGDPWLYAADNQPVMAAKEDEAAMVAWAHHKQQDYCPSIHMPRWASRFTLEALEDARLERLWDIREIDAEREGIECFYSMDATRHNTGKKGLTGYPSKVNAFAYLWSTLHTNPGERWEDNPEVVRVGEFKQV